MVTYSCEANSFGVVWCGVAIMNGQIVSVFTDACKQIAYMVKQLNYNWLTAVITAEITA